MPGRRDPPAPSRRAMRRRSWRTQRSQRGELVRGGGGSRAGLSGAECRRRVRTFVAPWTCSPPSRPRCCRSGSLRSLCAGTGRAATPSSSPGQRPSRPSPPRRRRSPGARPPAGTIGRSGSTTCSAGFSPPRSSVRARCSGRVRAGRPRWRSSTSGSRSGSRSPSRSTRPSGGDAIPNASTHLDVFPARALALVGNVGRHGGGGRDRARGDPPAAGRQRAHRRRRRRRGGRQRPRGARAGRRRRLHGGRGIAALRRFRQPEVAAAVSRASREPASSGRCGAGARGARSRRRRRRPPREWPPRPRAPTPLVWCAISRGRGPTGLRRCRAP